MVDLERKRQDVLEKQRAALGKIEEEKNDSPKRQPSARRRPSTRSGSSARSGLLLVFSITGITSLSSPIPGIAASMPMR
ncbi:hypothetical protein BAE29_06330 [Acidithiobacillus caldus]|uniref:Uncharacterized protein n=2 Tax=Acidithiobacillus caldus TaxID=33059 RepID=A0A1E7YP45_9PROT|nr:hypothetical protein BAE27_05400 [Acidithiobacillus caldus]OFC39918.1 hypothetical protein BAE29_06330 [Acidithiobacillus caldus]OFC39971.1 hypothetical protein BAE28_01785 [Acidithiobacillus caldus]